MSHDPRSRKCRGCGRVIGSGAFCYSCRAARRKAWRATRRGRSRSTSSKPCVWAVLASLATGSGHTPPAAAEPMEVLQ